MPEPQMSKARQQIFQHLSRKYPTEFEEIHTAEKAKEPVTGSPDTRKRPDTPPGGWTWMNRAACRGVDLELFFGVEGERGVDREFREIKAKRICETCPLQVRDDCLDHAILKPERDGVWGGMTPEERASERRRRLRRRPAA